MSIRDYAELMNLPLPACAGCAGTADPVPVHRQPSNVRLMWVPDHKDNHGSLVAAHYCYLSVIRDRGRQDSFELESRPTISDSNRSASTPGVYKE